MATNKKSAKKTGPQPARMNKSDLIEVIGKEVSSASVPAPSPKKK
jgi:hypothetical protein